MSNEIAPGFSISNVLDEDQDRKVIGNGCISEEQDLSPNDLEVVAEYGLGLVGKAKSGESMVKKKKKPVN